MSKLVVVPAGELEDDVAADPVNVSQYEAADFWVTGTFVGTVQVQESMDGTNWVDVSTALTAPGKRTLTSTAYYARMVCTAFTSGTIVGSVAGRDSDLRD